MEKLTQRIYTLARFANARDIMPTEQLDVCEDHLIKREQEGKNRGYTITTNPSSTPSAWCHDCNPELNTAEAHGY